ncbi:MAG: hypothetical protein K0Q70_432 [Rhodospirillales bacterium]|nr:hypothetical protein [Rhodospirillales bacterium]
MSASPTRVLGAALAVLSLSLAAPALAQKSKDTLRIGFVDPIEPADAYFFSKPEQGVITRSIYDGLIHFDDINGKFRPLLAKSWKWVDTKTLEMEIRDDVKFHNGKKFTIDDVMYQLNWTIDPKSNHQQPRAVEWIKSVEKLSATKFRIHAKQPDALALLRLAKSVWIYDSEQHAKFADKRDYGRKSFNGTGPYKITTFSENEGITAERVDSYNIGAFWKNASNIKRIQAMAIPDNQARVAHLLTDRLDVLKETSTDQTADLIKDPRFTSTALNGMNFTYFQIDATGRAGQKATMDPRVRKALFMAVNRQELATKLLPEGTQLMDALCFKFMTACGYSTQPPAYDPEGAKKLLAEAGFKDGFELQIADYMQETAATAIKVTGDLHKIGIKASVQKHTFTTLRKARDEGKLQALVAYYTMAGGPDASAGLDFFFREESRDYARDKFILEGMDKAAAELDEEKRRGTYQAVFDRINDQSYIMTMTTLPTVFVHTKDVAIRPGSLEPFGALGRDFFWN